MEKRITSTAMDDQNPIHIPTSLPAELAQLNREISDFTPDELRQVVILDTAVRQTLDPLKVSLLIEQMFLDLGFKAEIHILTSNDESIEKIPLSFNSPSMVRIQLNPAEEIAGDEFRGCIDLVPIAPSRQLTQRDRRFLDFFCRQVGSVLAHQYLYTQLVRTQEKLKSALDTLQEVSSFVGHEIRSPIASLHSLSYLIEDSVKSMNRQENISAEEWKILFERIGQVNVILQKIIRSTYLLGTLDMDPGTFTRDLEWVEMGKSLLISAASAYLQEIKNRNLRVVIRRESQMAQDYVLVDRTWFEAIFDNLLGNAIKYSSKEGRIDFSIVKRSGNYVIHVSNPVDVYPSTETLSRIFDKGVRGESDFNIKTIGTNQGLGLYFVNQIVTKGYGGSIRVWLEKERNRDGTMEGDEVETQVFGNPDAPSPSEDQTYFHIEIRIPEKFLSGESV